MRLLPASHEVSINQQVYSAGALMKLLKTLLFLSFSAGSLALFGSAQASDCIPQFHKRIDPTHDYEYDRSSETLDQYGFLYWYEYGLDAALSDDDADLGVHFCIAHRNCGIPAEWKEDKKTKKYLKKHKKALINADRKNKAKYKALLLTVLPERLPVTVLAAYKAEKGTCGMTPDMIKSVFEYELATASPDLKARQERCATAYDNLFEAKGTRPETVSMKDTVWAIKYKEDLAEGRFCKEPSEALLRNTFATTDPYASMPLDLGRPEHFRQFTSSLDFNAAQPLQSECEASIQGGTMMLEISPLAKPKPEEAAWMAHYKAARETGGICNPIPERIAEWGEDWVWQNGWPFAYDANTAKLDVCMEAVRVIANDHMGGEFARWMQGYNMRVLYPETRRPNGEICAGIPKPLQADLMPRIQAAREIRLAEEAERQRQLAIDYANAPPPPPSISDILQEWSRQYARRPIVVERCYTNQYGRYVCYDTVHTVP